MPVIMNRMGPMPANGSTHMATLERIDGLNGDLETEHGQCIRFVFRPVASLYERWQACALTSMALNEQSRLWSLLREMIGEEEFDKIDNGSDVTDALHTLIGETFEIAIEHRQVGEAVFLNVVSAELVSECLAPMEAE